MAERRLGWMMIGSAKGPITKISVTTVGFQVEADLYANFTETAPIILCDEHGVPVIQSTRLYEVRAGAHYSWEYTVAVTEMFTADGVVSARPGG